MPDEPIVDTMDVELAAIMTPPADATDPKLGEEAPKVVDPAAPAQVDPAAEVPLEDALKTIEEEAAEKEEPKSALTPEQARILALVPNEQVANEVAQTARNYNNFTQAFVNDPATAEAMLEAWNPAALEAFLEHIYAKRVASGEWVDRWIADKEGNPTTNKAVSRLEREIQSLKQQLTGRATAEQEAQATANVQRVYAAYNTHVDSLFDKINFSKADRRWVATDLASRVNASPQVKSAIMSGSPAAVNGLFKQAVREYVQRDQATSQVKAGVLAAQETKKPLLQSAPQATGALPENVNEVKKEDLDRWEDEQLTNLFAKAKKR